MAARVCPHAVRSAHQSMHHLVADVEWSDDVLLAAVAGLVLPSLTAGSGAIAWIVDDTTRVSPIKEPIRLAAKGIWFRSELREDPRCGWSLVRTGRSYFYPMNEESETCHGTANFSRSIRGYAFGFCWRGLRQVGTAGSHGQRTGA